MVASDKHVGCAGKNRKVRLMKCGLVIKREPQPPGELLGHAEISLVGFIDLAGAFGPLMRSLRYRLVTGRSRLVISDVIHRPLIEKDQVRRLSSFGGGTRRGAAMAIDTESHQRGRTLAIGVEHRHTVGR